MTEAACTNFLPHNMDSAYKDRTMIALWTNKRRKDKALMDVMRVEQTSSLQRMREDMREDVNVGPTRRPMFIYFACRWTSTCARWWVT
jgi:hypothetical protein